MIITKQKPFKDILKALKDDKKIFLIGCSLCATTCKTGGENELKDAEEKLKKEGKTVTGKAVLDPTCNLLEVKRLYRKHKDAIDSADAIVSFACGGGTQAVVDVIDKKEVFPGTDTLFQGEISEVSLKSGRFDQKCSLCGDCVLVETGGICPVTRCPKGLINGPCGGIKNGKCEVDPELECVWLLIYDRLKELGREEGMKKARSPKDHSKSKKPQKHVT